MQGYFSGLGALGTNGKPLPGEPTSVTTTEKRAGDTAAAIAVQAAIDEEEELIPFQETPDGGSPGGLQQYATHITIASTIIGMLMFIGWVYLKD